MPSTTLPTPTPDELDDLIYLTRTGDLASLMSLVTQLCTTHNCPPSILLASSIDIDADGLGSQSSLLHYPAANGNLEIITHLLSLLTPSDSLGASPSATTADKSAPSLVNHRNVSGNTPLHWAAMNGHLDVVQALVKAGADPTIVNEAGRDAVVEAEMSSKDGAKECAEWMLRHCEGLEKGVGDDGIGEGASGNRKVEEETKEEGQNPESIGFDEGGRAG
ncbi:uncharacterized protein Z520_10145 [Fonsecaea multimorphosa CBS 102226]|uniref:Uncharacterized protein n=1 Tax=Fonsecaea multimorphosa CBS 102226 TaxID=1442371 RepID=A0A0D2JUD7_9EURO|nr:uncharacterized protein Z520_10145 [Fonsecaea multimorphosa CBS 102226]KIX94119.1 hypothetical protein Z520_10145 [Fonsecaea multimorphosa CBS 102226]OAL19472.1 hypothetical protein AYO22_09634 [Fonsecaea multimorphosa]